MPLYDMDKIREDILPVYGREQTVVDSDNPHKFVREHYIVAKNGLILTSVLPKSLVAFIKDAMNWHHITYDMLIHRYKPPIILGQFSLDGDAYMKSTSSIIKMDTDGRPYLTGNPKYMEMLKECKQQVLSSFKGNPAKMPYRQEIELCAVFRTNNSLTAPRLTDLINVAIDMLIHYGIIISENQVVSLDGSGIERKSKNRIGMDVVVRAWNR